MASNQPKPRSRPARQSKSAGQEPTSEHSGEQLGSGQAGTAIITGETFGTKALQYTDLDGLAIFEGDICLGSVAEVNDRNEAIRSQAGAAGDIAFSVGISATVNGVNRRWSNCTVPYEIDPALPNQSRVTDAIAHWHANTSIRFVVRTTQADWVRFVDSGGCWSHVGRQGGRQDLSLSAGCSVGNAIHEIGHAVGLWHEQSREDRDAFVAVQWGNITAGMEHNFNQHIADGDDNGAYDYGSIMHYPRNAFTKNGNDTLVPTVAGVSIGQRAGLSAGDIAGVRAMYPACGLVKPPWADQRKKLFDDRPSIFKKIRDDIYVTKPIHDLPGKIDKIGPIKLDVPEVLNPAINPVITGLGRGASPVLPFALATGHHADLGSQSADEVAAEGFAVIEQMSATLEQVDAAITATLAMITGANQRLADLQQIRDEMVAGLQQSLDFLEGSG